MSDSAFDRLSVLLVDDNRFMRGVLHTLLQAFGVHRIYDAGDGSEALQRLRNTPVDLVICDSDTKPMDGLALTRSLRADPDRTKTMLPLLLLSGHDDERQAATARDAGVTEILGKPLSPRDLYLCLRAALESPRPFVQTEGYRGPSRRRQTQGFAGSDRRAAARPARTPVNLGQLSALIEERSS